MFQVIQVGAYKCNPSRSHIQQSSSKLLTTIFTQKKMRLLNVLPVVITMLFLMGMHEIEAGRILHGGQQELMNKNLLLGSPRGQVLPFAPNPNPYKPSSTISQRAFVGHNLDSLQGLLDKGVVPPSATNPGTTASQRAFMGHNIASVQGSLLKGPVQPSVPNPDTNKIPFSTVSQRAFVDHNMVSLQNSLDKGPVPPSVCNPVSNLPNPSCPPKK